MATYLTSIPELPNLPAVYALYGGAGRSQYVAYVGIADRLKERITQHLVRRDSSIVTGVSTVGLNPDLVTEVRWWVHPEFSDRSVLQAGELLAFDALEPALRSRGGITGEAKTLYNTTDFRNRMLPLFTESPAGRLVRPTLHDAMQRITELERDVALLKSRVQP
jgi:hypothetical protein